MFCVSRFGFPRWLSGKEFPTNEGDSGNMGSIPQLERSPGGRHGNPPQYSCLKNARDRGAGGLQSMGLQEPDITVRT